ncbi:RecT family recombinase [Pantoea sp. EA-12]|uniref:RecT family recombinase n=1 Tax=Pantoea sp. EA-12 TaxID=3043303 RepID=UPI0024B56B93|nr:RecT family recombinase [Pantoea sp. EA-12]MDI9222085.1 RecT family recombinase [Pantoea sp. EA-12]
METQLMESTSENTSTAATIFSPDALDKLVRFAEIMACSRVTVPAHLTGKASDCLAVTMQALQWRMNPFAVAQKTFMVNGVLGYEAQLVNAVITTMAPTRDRIQYAWFGPWEKVIGKFVERTSPKGNKYAAPGWTLADETGCGVRVWATMKNEEEPRELEILLTQAQVRNSTLWASDPKQQLAYLAVKRWARLHCPDVILGVYTPDEIDTAPPVERDITPGKSADLNALINQSRQEAEGGGKHIEAVEVEASGVEQSASETPPPALPPNPPAPQPVVPASKPTPRPTRTSKAKQTEEDNQERTPDKLLADFCEAALNAETVSAVARCYAYASKVLAATPELLEKATDVFLVRKAEIEEAVSLK